MNDQEHIQSLELPQPVDGSGSAGESRSNNLPAYEIGQALERQTSPSSSPPQQMTTQNDSSQQQPILQTAIPAPMPAYGVPATSSPLTAADNDLIEKEWVSKAKEMVARTHGDPFNQNKEINKIKAEYIKKRYNKDIKQGAE